MTGKKKGKKKAPFTKRALQTTINERDQQIKDMKQAGSINLTANLKSKLRLKSEIRVLKRENEELKEGIDTLEIAKAYIGKENEKLKKTIKGYEDGK